MHINMFVRMDVNLIVDGQKVYNFHCEYKKYLAYSITNVIGGRVVWRHTFLWK